RELGPGRGAGAARRPRTTRGAGAAGPGAGGRRRRLRRTGDLHRSGGPPPHPARRHRRLRRLPAGRRRRARPAGGPPRPGRPAAGRQLRRRQPRCRRRLARQEGAAGPHRRRRRRRLLLDEFQDTDPIQIELAARIAAAEPRSEVAGAAPWGEVPLADGHLFVVGDPKQSIYRFRRADISTFLAAKALLGPAGGGPVQLTANFRTVRPVIDWVNATFGALFGEPVPDGLPPSQADYTALEPVRAPAPAGPAVAVVGRDPHPSDARADDLRAA